MPQDGWPEKPTRVRKQTSMQFNEGDERLIEFIAQYLGTSKADAIRSSVRAFASNLQAISKSQI